MIINYLVLCIGFYLIGSIPTAYLIVKFRYKKNLTKEGTGNIGAKNTYDVTNSKLDGISVLVIDFLKGFIPAYWLLNFVSIQFDAAIFPMLCLIIGHNFSVWLKFKGGRGLATGAGVMAPVNFTLVLTWLILYFVFYRIARNVHIACVIALVILPVMIFILKDVILRFNNSIIPFEDAAQSLFSFTAAVCIIILLKHIDPILELVRKRRET